MAPSKLASFIFLALMAASASVSMASSNNEMVIAERLLDMECMPQSQCCPGSKPCDENGQFCTICTRSNPPFCFCTPPPPTCAPSSTCCSDADCTNGNACSMCTKSYTPVCHCTTKKAPRQHLSVPELLQSSEAVGKDFECRENSECCPGSKPCSEGRLCVICDFSFPPSCICSPSKDKPASILTKVE